MSELIDRFIAESKKTILGKEHQTKLALACLLSRGHLLIEDVPGVGKTTFAKTIAKLCGLSFARIQFTNDLMPSDLLGVQIYSNKEESFQTLKGPIFHHMIMADELNRATPKTQSALLEAMEENQVTIDGKTFILPKPFFVIATQNPRSSIGTHLLPESQLDRFMMKIEIGYPNPIAEREMIASDDHQTQFQHLNSVYDQESLQHSIHEVHNIHASEAIYNYILNLLMASRTYPQFRGLSPRAGKDLMRAAKAWAYIHKRDHVLPDDIQQVLENVVSHRLPAHHGLHHREEKELTQSLIKLVPVD